MVCFQPVAAGLVLAAEVVVRYKYIRYVNGGVAADQGDTFMMSV